MTMKNNTKRKGSGLFHSVFLALKDTNNERERERDIRARKHDTQLFKE